MESSEYAGDEYISSPHSEVRCAWSDFVLWVLEIPHHSLLRLLVSMPVTRSQSVTTSERAESQHPEPPPITWSKHNQSPKAEVILVSSDNVSFRVDVWYLKQKRYARQWMGGVRLMNSGFIKDLLDIPSHQPIETAPIQLDPSLSICRTFCGSGTVLRTSLDVYRAR